MYGPETLQHTSVAKRLKLKVRNFLWLSYMGKTSMGGLFASTPTPILNRAKVDKISTRCS